MRWVLESNGNFLKVIFAAITVFFFAIITYQVIYQNSEHVGELLAAIIVFYALTGRKVVDAYSESRGVQSA